MPRQWKFHTCGVDVLCSLMRVPEPSQRSVLWGSLELAFELGYLIAIPIVLFGLGGRFLDRWLGTSPWLLLAGIVLAIVLSGIGVSRKIRAISRAEFSEDSSSGDRSKAGRGSRSSL